MNAPLLSLRSYGVAFGDDVILADVSFDLPRRGLTVLVGPAGGGKSTLLRTLAGANDGHPALWTWGRARYSGGLLPEAPVEEAEVCDIQRPSLVMQHARFFLDTVRENLVSGLANRSELCRAEQTDLVVLRLAACGLAELSTRLEDDAVSLSLEQQRRLAIARALMAEPAALFADEPAAGLDEDEANDVVEMLRDEARSRSVLLVTHNQRVARRAGGTLVVLAGGRVQEIAPTERFFAGPTTDAGRTWLRTGRCLVPGPGARAEDLDDTQPLPPPLPVAASRSAAVGPRGFFWVKPGRLGGTPRPGIVDELEHDVSGLRRLGVTRLVTLEEERTVDSTVLAAAGITSVHFPIVDMQVPELTPALELSRRIESWSAGGDVVAVHCRAGLGRTGTTLACQLIWDGASAIEALDRVRGINPKCIQSDVQVSFLPIFEAACRSVRRAGSAT